MGVHTISVSYIPNPDPEALHWLENFAQQIEPKPEALGVPASDAASLIALIRDFSRKLEIVICPRTCTSPAISEKIVARNAAVVAARTLAKAIRANPAATDQDLLSLGLPARPGPRRQSIPPRPAPPRFSVSWAASTARTACGMPTRSRPIPAASRLASCTCSCTWRSARP